MKALLNPFPLFIYWQKYYRCCSNVFMRVNK